MRVITGTARGRRLITPEGLDTRPTTDKVKEAICSSLQFDFPGANVLDLFAGSGQMAIEALSRGARRATLVDADQRAIACIRQNVKACGFADQATVLKSDAVSFLQRTSERFDIAFLDPPYRMTEVYAQALSALLAADRLAEDALIVMEHDAASPIEGIEPPFAIEDQRKYRDTALTLARYRDKKA